MQAPISRTDIAIVGLGPVGAVAANLCGAMGFSVVVLDRDVAPFAQPRAIVFDSEIMRVFASIGLGAEIQAVTRPLEGSVYLGADGRPIRTFRSPGPAYPGAWAPTNLFYQPQLEGLLRESLARFPRVDVRKGWQLTAIAPSPEGTRLEGRTADGGSFAVEARFVLACDGASSTVRKALGIGLDDIGFEERWLVMDALMRGAMRWPARYEIPEEVRGGRFSLMVCDPAGPATIIPGRGDHRRWEYMLAGQESDAEAVSPERLSERLSDWVDPGDVEIVRTAVYRFRALIARQWRRNAVFLLGDAAHQTPPFYGQGMCHGIRDAAQLLWKLRLVADGQATPALLDSYQEEREPHVREIIRASVTAGAAVCITDSEKAKARDAEFRALEAARGKATVAMTDVVPPLRAGVIDAGGGERLPEFVVERKGRTEPLDAVLGNRFAILSAAPLALDPALLRAWHQIGGQVFAGSADLTDPSGRLARYLAERSASALIVRPDRYVFAATSSAADLEATLSQLFARFHGDAAAKPKKVASS